MTGYHGMISEDGTPGPCSLVEYHECYVCHEPMTSPEEWDFAHDIEDADDDADDRCHPKCCEHCAADDELLTSTVLLVPSLLRARGEGV